MSLDTINTPLLEDLALRNLLARYTDAVNLYKPEQWIECWASDAEWQLMGNRVVGRGNIFTLWKQLMSNFDYALMMPGSSQFTLDRLRPDRAEGHCYQHEYTRDRNGNGSVLVGRYADAFTKIDGHWYFQSRHYQVLYEGTSELTRSLPPL